MRKMGGEGGKIQSRQEGEIRRRGGKKGVGEICWRGEERDGTSLYRDAGKFTRGRKIHGGC